MDEFEYWTNIDLQHFYNQIAEPRTYATKGRIFIMSNPNGQENYGSELENMRLPNGTKKFHTYIFNFLDRPGNTQEDLELDYLYKTTQMGM